MREDADRPGRGDDGSDWFAANAPPTNYTNTGPLPVPRQTAPPGYHIDPTTGATVWDGGGGVPQPTINPTQPIAPQLPGQTWPQGSPNAAPNAAPQLAAAAPSSGGGGGNQFTGWQGGDPTGFGVPPAPYRSSGAAPSYTAPARPDVLNSPYVAPVWQGGDFTAPTKPASLQSEFRAPTQAELEASPGYQARLTADQQARERSAAARGTILNGGTQLALGHAAQDYASNEYNNLFGQSLQTRAENVGEYNTSFTDAFGAYLQKYRTFTDASQAGLTARQQTQGEYQTSVNNAQTQYANQYSAYQNENARTLNDYLTNYGIKRTSENDLWGRQNDVANRGLTAALGSRVS